MGHIKKQPDKGRINVGTALLILGAIGIISAVISFCFSLIVCYGPPDLEYIIWFASGVLVFVIGVALRGKSDIDDWTW